MGEAIHIYWQISDCPCMFRYKSINQSYFRPLLTSKNQSSTIVHSFWNPRAHALYSGHNMLWYLFQLLQLFCSTGWQRAQRPRCRKGTRGGAFFHLCKLKQGKMMTMGWRLDERRREGGRERSGPVALGASSSRKCSLTVRHPQNRKAFL